MAGPEYADTSTVAAPRPGLLDSVRRSGEDAPDQEAPIPRELARLELEVSRAERLVDRFTDRLSNVLGPGEVQSEGVMPREPEHHVALADYVANLRLRLAAACTDLDRIVSRIAL